MKRALLAVLAVILLLAAAVYALNLRDEERLAQKQDRAQATATQVARGEDLALAGNCMGCHTARGGEPYAGGRGIETPFGTVYTSNLTPDPATGLGNWGPDHFWRALHNGRSRDGRLLYPAFPYTNYTVVTREDADAIYAYLHSLKPVVQANREHGLRFPFNTQAALAVWRALYFSPARRVNDPKRPAEWNRGAYLVQGLGHCNACHGSRNALGATGGTLDLGGGLIPMQNWYAPSLSDPREAGVATWETQQVVALLKTGISAKASVLGPMAEVVGRSTQYLTNADLQAMASYLQALPSTHRESAAHQPGNGVVFERGAKLYAEQCADCHGKQGEGVASMYPALAGNRAVTMASTANVVRVVREGGFAPSTAGNPRPYGMPPFATLLSPAETAAVLTYVRGAWGNRGAAVSEIEVNRYR
ncbi:MAG: cytochrome c [Cytophagales bacterium]|nr:cytochrome c [Rhizobacter sp.]